MRNKGKFKNPIEFMGKCGGLPGKMDRALEKSGERGRDFLCCFFPEEPLYYISYTMETIYANGGLHMKGKRVLSLALAALMTLSLLVVPAAAVRFTDMTNHWAKDDVEYLATQGVVKGTSATTFAPDQKMTACEALLFCSRATGVDAIDKEAIAEDWEDELKEILPEEMYAWAAQEMAVCLETGIISETELRTIRVIIPSVMAPAAIAGRIRCCMREEKV